MRRSFLFVFFFCAAASMLPAAPGDAFEKVPPPSADKAQIILYRVRKFGGAAVKYHIFDATAALAEGKTKLFTLDGVQKIEMESAFKFAVDLGKYYSGDYVVLASAPGTCTFFASQAQDKVNNHSGFIMQTGVTDDVTQIPVVGGKRYFVRADIGWGGRPHLSTPPEADALKDLKKCSEINPSR